MEHTEPGRVSVCRQENLVRRHTILRIDINAWVLRNGQIPPAGLGGITFPGRRKRGR